MSRMVAPMRVDYIAPTALLYSTQGISAAYCPYVDFSFDAAGWAT